MYTSQFAHSAAYSFIMTDAQIAEALSLLGLEANDHTHLPSTGTINRAFKQLARMRHPDKNTHSEEARATATAHFQQLSQARDYLLAHDTTAPHARASAGAGCPVCGQSVHPPVGATQLVFRCPLPCGALLRNPHPARPAKARCDHTADTNTNASSSTSSTSAREASPKEGTWDAGGEADEAGSNTAPTQETAPRWFGEQLDLGSAGAVGNQCQPQGNQGRGCPFVGGLEVETLQALGLTREDVVVVWRCRECKPTDASVCCRVSPKLRCVCGHTLRQHNHRPGPALERSTTRSTMTGSLAQKKHTGNRNDNGKGKGNGNGKGKGNGNVAATSHTARHTNRRLTAPATATAEGFGCSERCRCLRFEFLVANNGWQAKCRCKHTALEHSPATSACEKDGCPCAKFGASWICNCGHGCESHHTAFTRSRGGLDRLKFAREWVTAGVRPELAAIADKRRKKWARRGVAPHGASNAAHATANAAIPLGTRPCATSIVPACTNSGVGADGGGGRGLALAVECNNKM